MHDALFIIERKSLARMFEAIIFHCISPLICSMSPESDCNLCGEDHCELSVLGGIESDSNGELHLFGVSSFNWGLNLSLSRTIP